MSVDELRPDVNKIMEGLKDFQRRTVDYVFNRLFIDREPARRFLIADEVGLGKTLVARGVIAMVVNHLWDKVNRLDIIYICSNSEIARQNISKLNITRQKDFALASRITLLPVNLKDIKHNKINFVSFTPGTSFDLRSQGGIKRERALLYHILREEWSLGNKKKYMNVFQGSAGESWPDYLKDFLRWNDIDQDLAQDFLKKLNLRIKQSDDLREVNIRSRLEDLSERFDGRRRQENQDWNDRNKLIGDLRGILAESCVTALEPDLVILDEFQRFKHLLDGQDQMSQLAGYLFNYRNTKTILLSATPYKMYTMHHEIDDNHYEDFIRTVKFLLDSDSMTEDLKGRIRDYRNELYRVDANHREKLETAKFGVEKILKKVMSRTERLGVTTGFDGMVEEKRDAVSPSKAELTSFICMDRLSRALNTGDCLEYWKSSPYLLNFMEDYRFKREFDKNLDKPELMEALNGAGEALLPWKVIRSYKKLDPCNSKLHTLIENSVSRGGWKLLWIPPSMPYYKPRGVYNDPGLRDFTKALVFSSWQVVPKVVATLCSYEAEREMVTLFDRKVNYKRERKRRSPLLRFSKQEGRLTGMPLFTLHYPCVTLAERIDPYIIGLDLCTEEGIPDYKQVSREISLRISALLESSGIYTGGERSGQADERWYWAALVALDRHFYPDVTREWLQSKGKEWREMVKGKQDSDTDGSFVDHVDAIESYFNIPEKLGPAPIDLVDVLVKSAMASPAVVALRALRRRWENGNPCLLLAAAQVAMSFRNMYNLPETITLIRGLDDSEPYWKRALEYGAEGNLQAVLDEYLHVLYESQGLSGYLPDEAVKLAADIISGAVSLRTANLDYDEVILKRKSSELFILKHSLRCRYALRFGEGRNDDDGGVTRQDQVRNAFNSPFRPFVLATTSIGQEGLDFHQYCHSIYHWNLPSNPVDLEQREGRIHRYKGHVIRKNVALKYGLADIARQGIQFSDPWEEIFTLALQNRDNGFNDLVPFWIFEVGNGYKIERHVPVFPLSRDIDHLSDLKRTLAAYRMVFGQARQEDLLNFILENTDDSRLADILSYKIDLSPGGLS